MGQMQTGEQVMWIHPRDHAPGDIEAVAAKVLRVGTRRVMIVMEEWSGSQWRTKRRWVAERELALRSTPVPFIDRLQ